ncbi:MAG: DNA-binding response regulator [Actinobacteria bacterium 69-20]|jgi:DNA-binding NarL/FixJ family response regulator|nr:response regulator transcription factor [Actinomycetota bacterium]OJV24583.1 MAG: DNA-binding response regulator [Actinobacteria bacterium 69-20]
MIRVLVADDQALVRAGFRMILEHEDDVEVCGEAADGAAAVQLAKQSRPDVVLMDIRMPGVDGVQATRRISEDPTFAARVLILTTFDLDEYVYSALRAGASGFLLKDVDPPELVAAVRAVARGDALLAPTVTRRLIEQYTRRPPPTGTTPESLARLTDREVEILRHVARGSTNAEIAARLYLSPATVKTHVARILGKLDLRDRVQAVVLAYESGLIEPGDADARR